MAEWCVSPLRGQPCLERPLVLRTAGHGMLRTVGVPTSQLASVAGTMQRGEGEGYAEKDRTDTFAGLTASVCHGMLVRCPLYSASA